MWIEPHDRTTGEAADEGPIQTRYHVLSSPRTPGRAEFSVSGNLRWRQSATRWSNSPSSRRESGFQPSHDPQCRTVTRAHAPPIGLDIRRSDPGQVNSST